jgi:dephospho-CoA kinase
MIIGLTGSYGAGKGSVVEYLKSKGFTHYSASGYITEEIERRGLTVNRDAMIEVANDLRHTHGATYIIEQLYARALEVGGDVIIESLRAVAEVDKIRALGGVVIGIDADKRLRYERSQKRGSVKDGVTFEHWEEQERKEMNPDDPEKQDVFGALKKSDIIIQNNSTLEDLYSNIDFFFEKYGEYQAQMFD